MATVEVVRSRIEGFRIYFEDRALQSVEESDERVNSKPLTEWQKTEGGAN